MKMKNLLFALVLSVGTLFTAQAQRIAVVDINEVLENLDDYQSAQQQLDKIAAEWRQDIAQEYDKIKSMYNKYQAEQVLLSDDAKTQKEEEIMTKEAEVRQLQKDRFGPEGSLFQRRQELVQPIQERVYSAIEDYAGDRGYDFIFDKGGAAGLLFSNPEYEKTEDILKRLGVN
jgi:outer membrane protein